jgi:hypothetical protein
VHLRPVRFLCCCWIALASRCRGKTYVRSSKPLSKSFNLVLSLVLSAFCRGIADRKGEAVGPAFKKSAGFG